MTTDGLISTLMITSDLEQLHTISTGLGADVIVVPPCPVTEGASGGYEAAWSDTALLQTWRERAVAGPPCTSVVVAVWPVDHRAGDLTDMSAGEFARRMEWPFAAWYSALGAATARVADGGSIVALVERPSPLDCAGWSPEGGLADAVEALVRSLARSEGRRGVRVNAVTTPSRLAPAAPIAPAPPLATFPGRVEVEVAEAVAMVLGSGVTGVTGTVVHVDCGRSWR